jgi:hypothetical protein
LKGERGFARGGMNEFESLGLGLFGQALSISFSDRSDNLQIIDLSIMWLAMYPIHLPPFKTKSIIHCFGPRESSTPGTTLACT